MPFKPACIFLLSTAVAFSQVAAWAQETQAAPALSPAARPAPAAKPSKAAKAKARPEPSRSKARARRGEAEDEVIYGSREDVLAFAQATALTHSLDAQWVAQVLAQARMVPSVTRAIMPPPAGTAKNWAAYRDRFIEPRRIEAGLAFWLQHEQAAARAEAETGVPAEILVSIVGVETFYGRIMGRHRVLDALATLSFDFPTGRSDRSGYFRGELAQFLVMCQQMKLDPQTPRGSFAGAMGLPQFMPSSVLRDAVDFDGDGHIDLHQSGPDALGSVARFLQQRGWIPGLATHFPVAEPVDTAQRAVLLAPDIRPTFTRQAMQAQGARFEPALHPALDAAGELALVELQNGEQAPSFVAGTRNFYVITRYNWSSYYAMAVIELAQRLRESMAKRSASPPAQPAPAASQGL
jgi:membrane-bound lytic murein transglycosylase B